MLLRYITTPVIQTVEMTEEAGVRVTAAETQDDYPPPAPGFWVYSKGISDSPLATGQGDKLRSYQAPRMALGR